MRRSEKKIGDILISKGLLTAEQLERALDEQRRTKEFLGAILVKRRFILEKDLLKAFSEQFAIPVEDIGNAYIDWGIARRFDPTLIMECKCFPVKKDDSTVTVAMTNPLDVIAMKKAEESIRGFMPRFVLVSKEDMAGAVERYKQFMRRSGLSELFK